MSKIRERLQAAGMHFLLSCVVALLAFILVYGVWYPSPLAAAVGVGSVFWLVLLVDVSIGPLLTGVVYKKGKKTLRFDLVVIAVLQIAALLYGLWTIGTARPVWMVYNADRFDLVQAHDVDYRYAEKVQPEFLRPSWLGPRWAASRNPEDPEERNQLVLESALGGSDLPQRVDLFVPLNLEWDQVLAKSLPLQDLKKFNSPAQVDHVLKDVSSAARWLPLMARAKSMVVLVEEDSANPLTIVDLRPWN